MDLFPIRQVQELLVLSVDIIAPIVYDGRVPLPVLPGQITPVEYWRRSQHSEGGQHGFEASRVPRSFRSQEELGTDYEARGISQEHDGASDRTLGLSCCVGIHRRELEWQCRIGEACQVEPSETACLVIFLQIENERRANDGGKGGGELVDAPGVGMVCRYIASKRHADEEGGSIRHQKEGTDERGVPKILDNEGAEL